MYVNSFLLQEKRICCPSGQVVMGDLMIIKNESLRNILSKGHKYRKPRSRNWNYNFKLLTDAVDKREQEDIDSLVKGREV